MRRLFLVFSIPAIIALVFLSTPGCARQPDNKQDRQGAVKSFHSGNLDVSEKGKTSRTIFIDVHGSDTAALAAHLENALRSARYEPVDSPSKAGYILHVTLVREGDVGKDAFPGIVNAGYGGDATFTGSGASGIITDALLVKRRVPTASKPGHARLKNISTRNAIDNSRMRIGLLADRPVRGAAERNSVFAEPLARELGNALGSNTMNTAAITQ